MSDELIIPDEVEPTVGWRAWGVSREGALCSFNGTEWPEHEAIRARCYVLRPPPDQPSYSMFSVHRHDLADTVVAGCTCGIYAKRTARGIDRHIASSGEGYVVGTVKLWGRIIVGSDGYRAEYAYPDHLYLIMRPTWKREPEWHREGRARLIAQHYGVPCTLITLDEWRLLLESEPEEERAQEGEPQESEAGVAPRVSPSRSRYRQLVHLIFWEAIAATLIVIILNLWVLR